MGCVWELIKSTIIKYAKILSNITSLLKHQLFSSRRFLNIFNVLLLKRDAISSIPNIKFQIVLLPIKGLATQRL